jgi:hypothetical protein
MAESDGQFLEQYVVFPAYHRYLYLRQFFQYEPDDFYSFVKKYLPPIPRDEQDFVCIAFNLRDFAKI